MTIKGTYNFLDNTFLLVVMSTWPKVKNVVVIPVLQFYPFIIQLLNVK